MKNLNLLLFLLVLIILSSCTTTGKINYLQSPEKIGVKAYERLDSATLYADYRLIPGDQVYVRIVTANDEAKKPFFAGIGNMDYIGMTGQASQLYCYTIYADSCIEYPFVGQIKLGGYTTREAKSVIKKAIEPYIPDCDIDVRLVNSFYTIIGNAGTGHYPISQERLTIFQALSMSGDLKDFSDRKRIHILRPTANGTQIREFDVRSRDIVNSEFYYIQPNDIIYVQSFHGQFFGITSFTGIFSTVTSTLSFGILIYNLITKYAK